MNLKSIEELSAQYIKNLCTCVSLDGYTLTDIVFYKGDEDMAHVEIKAKRNCEDHESKPLWWVCALPLAIPNECMLPSQGDLSNE